MSLSCFLSIIPDSEPQQFPPLLPKLTHAIFKIILTLLDNLLHLRILKILGNLAHYESQNTLSKPSLPILMLIPFQLSIS